MNYRSVESLSRDVRVWSERLPWDLDVIVGVPRSGMLPASLLATHRNLPLADVEGFIEGRVFTSGASKRGAHLEDPLTRPCKILVVDDSVGKGFAMKAVRSQIEAAGLPHTVLYSAVYVRPESAKYVDLYCREVGWPRAFEWNIMHHCILPSSCLDIDGVLCRDPSASENDDGTVYKKFLQTVAPRVVPSQKVGWLVTCRLERYRELTEEWMARHGIEYGELVMMDYPDKAARAAAAAYGKFKAQVYRRVGARLFIESSSRQAGEIAKRAGKPVLCLETNEMILPGQVSRCLQTVPNFSWRVCRKLHSVLGSIVGK